MKKLLTFTIVSLLLFGRCTNDPLPVSSSGVDQQALKIEAAKSELLAYVHDHNIQPRLGPGADKASLSISSAARTAGEPGLSLLQNPDYEFHQAVIARVINPDDYDCAPTAIDYYVQSLIQDWTLEDFTLYFYFGGVAFDIVYVYDNQDGGQYYGSKGQFTTDVKRTYKDLLRFWNIPTDILLRDAHGNIYNDLTRVASMLQLYGYPEEDAVGIAQLLQVVYGSAKYFSFNHPLLTFNAFAARADNFFGTPKKLVMGDGIMQAYADLGFGDVAPQSILAHEYGHHVQFAKNVLFEGTPEGTRRTELMADAFGAYYLTHKRGATMNWKRVQQFLQVYFVIGDCQFGSPGHHGTPNQRLKAATFGYNVARSAQRNGHIMTAEDFIILFEAELPTILEPDNS